MSDKYIKGMQRNIKLSYIKTVFRFLYFFVPIWYIFETQFVSIETLSLMYAVGHILTISLELPTGALADLIGRKKTIFVGFILEGLAYFVISQITGPSLLWLGFVLHSLSATLVSGSDVALQYDSLLELKRTKEFGKISSNIGMLIQISLAISGILGGYIYAFHMRLPYILTAISLLVASILTLFNVEPKIDSEKFTLENYISQTKLGFLQLVKTKYIKDFSLFYMLVGGITFYFLTFLGQAYITDIGFTGPERGWLFASMYLVAATINFFYYRIDGRFSRTTIYGIFAFLIILGTAPAFLVSKLWAIPLAFSIQLAGDLRFTILSEYSNMEFESKYRATAISALNMLVSFVFIVLTLIGGVVIKTWGTPVMMSVVGCLAIVTILPSIYVMIKNPDRKL